ncbi:hypothetical protein, partial [Cronobacter sakazakii]
RRLTNAPSGPAGGCLPARASA